MIDTLAPIAPAALCTQPARDAAEWLM